MTDSQRVLVCGGRDYTDQSYAFKALDALHALRSFGVVIEGGARGGDALGRTWAESRGVLVQTFPANWERYGRRAGSVRNCQMLREGKPDLVVAFSGGTGTAHMIRISEEAGIEVFKAISPTLC